MCGPLIVSLDNISICKKAHITTIQLTDMMQLYLYELVLTTVVSTICFEVLLGDRCIRDSSVEVQDIFDGIHLKNY